MGSLDKLKTELIDDPRGQGLPGMSHENATANLHLENIPQDVVSVTGQQIYEATTLADRQALTADQRAELYAIIGMGTILVNGTNTKAALLDMFGAETDTRDNLAALQTTLVSWASLNWSGRLRAGDVQRARKVEE